MSSKKTQNTNTSTAGMTIWAFGLPGSGKTTTVCTAADLLEEEGVRCYVLDGDDLRKGLNSDLKYDRASRAENARRTACTARRMADAGLVTFVSLVTPYGSDRERAQKVHEEWRLPFYQVFIDAPLSECMRRDPKGLYEQANTGEVTGLTGLDDPFEVPEAADLIIDTLTLSPEQAAEALASRVTYWRSYQPARDPDNLVGKHRAYRHRFFRDSLASIKKSLV